MEKLLFSDIFNSKLITKDILTDLLKDQTTGKFIVWATNSYQKYGAFYHKEKQMYPKFVLNLILDQILLPRVQKSKTDQEERTKTNAEVFTPSWVCNLMNNYCDEDYFGRKNVFNSKSGRTWTVTEEPVIFTEEKTKRYTGWQKYVDLRRLEITCGEAPYLVSRYDTTTGEYLPIQKRIGIIDRKLRIVNENTKTEEEWLKWARRAFESSYGYEYQGDNLFLARVNLLLTYIDYYEDRFKKEIPKRYIKEIVRVISWNLWQMDGISNAVPFGIPKDDFTDENKEEDNQDPIFAMIRNWRSEITIQFNEIKRSVDK